MLEYLVCATQRSGSTLLCEMLAQTGIAGTPNEYLLQWEEHRTRTEPRFWHEAVDYIKRLGRTPNGVWGCKVMARYFPAMMDCLRNIPEAVGLSDWEIARRAFGDPPVIRIRRRDRVKHAISNYIADLTKVYHMASHGAGDDPFLGQALKPRRDDYNASVPFDRNAIQRYVVKLGREESYWDAQLRDPATRVLTIVYEEFLDRKEPAIREALDFLGIPHRGVAFEFREHMARLYNSVNERFYREYHEGADRSGNH
ncbi:MAG: Stf0 family sulfotransferase [Planctomycetota bacterium]